jgi:hypothetical protein
MTTLVERSGDRTARGGLSAYEVDLIAVNTSRIQVHPVAVRQPQVVALLDALTSD